MGEAGRRMEQRQGGGIFGRRMIGPGRMVGLAVTAQTNAQLLSLVQAVLYILFRFALAKS